MIKENAKRQEMHGDRVVKYLAKLPKHQLVKGIDAPFFEIVTAYSMVKNAICIKVPIVSKTGKTTYRYIVKHYDTIILQWLDNGDGIIFEKFEYNCSPTSNRQIDSIMSVLFPDANRPDYKKLNVYNDNKNAFKGTF